MRWAIIKDNTVKVHAIMVNSGAVDNLEQTKSSGGVGCWNSILIPLVGLWISGVIAICQSATWILEQNYFISVTPAADPRWMIGLAGAVAIWLPAFLFSRIASPTLRPIFKSWRTAVLLVILMTPARWLPLTDSQGVELIQLAALSLFLLVALLGRGNKKSSINRTGRFSVVYLAAGAGGLLLFPWAAWGALGSTLDVLLGGLTALLGGMAAARVLAGVRLPEEQISSRFARWMAAIAAPVGLAIIAFGLGLNGNEWLLLIVFPPLGWFAVLLQNRFRSPSPFWLLALFLGLGFSGPLVWIDPDELALIVTSGQGELMEWALKAGLASLGITLIGMIVTGWILPRIDPEKIKRAAIAWAGVVWVGLGLVYFLVGQPGWYGDQLFVILKEQADLSGFQKINDVSARRSEVYQTLVETADRSQVGLRQDLYRWGIKFQPYYLENALEVEAGPLVKAWLLSRPEVDRVLASPHLRPLPAPLPIASGNDQGPASPQWNITMVHANQVWDELGITGKGILIGQSDSGVEGSHPELASQYRGQDGQNDGSWFDPWFHTTQPVDIGGHGTHTLGTILGKNVGIAPGAQWIGCVNLARNLGNPALYLDCMQFMLAPFPQNGDPFRDGQPEKGAQVLNNSWGCPVVEGCDPDTFVPAVRALETAGIFVVASAGNDGEMGCGSVRDPIAIYGDVFSVGAVDSDGQRASFSSLGPVTVDGSGRPKPDLAAPGDQVLSAFPNHTYAVLSGTSMAGPHVVGTVALMWSANPELVGNITETRRILEMTAAPYHGRLASCGTGTTPNDTVGYGIVDAYAAVQQALAEKSAQPHAFGGVYIDINQVLSSGE